MTGDRRVHDGHEAHSDGPDKCNTCYDKNVTLDKNVTVQSEPIDPKEDMIYAAEDEFAHAIATARHVLEKDIQAEGEVTVSFEARFRLHKDGVHLRIRVFRPHLPSGTIDVSSASLEDAVQEFMRRVRFDYSHPPITIDRDQT